MRTKLYQNWWLLFVKGILIIAIGLAVVINPQIMAARILLLLGIAMGLSGLALVVGAISHRRYNYEWTWWLIEGLVDILVGVLIIINPFDSAFFFAFVIGVWMVIMGFIHIATAINIQYYIPGNLVFVATAVILIVSGLFFMIKPVSGLKVLMVLIGIFMLIYGILQLYISLVLKNVVVEEIGEIEDFT